MLDAYNNECALRVISEGNKLDSQTVDDLNYEFGILLKNKKECDTVMKKSIITCVI